MRKFILFSIIIGTVGMAYAQQQIDDFYLSGFENKGQKNWEVRGKSAEINNDKVNIKDVDGYSYLEEKKINVKADKGAYNKQDSSMKLQDNVVITSEDGVQLNTDSLQWDQKKNLIETNDTVKIRKDKEMELQGDGFQADTQMKNAVLDKNVEVKFNKKDQTGMVVVTCDGPVEMNYNEGNAVFNKNVKMTDNELEMNADIARMFFNTTSKKIEKVIVEGNVKIIRGKDVTYAQKATYYDSNKKVILEGSPKLIFFPQK